MDKGLIRGGESTSHDSGNDILYTIKETGQQVLIEGDEYHLCKAALMSNEIHEYKNKTNKEILEDIYTHSSCMVKEGEANVGDFIICKLAVRDKKKRNLTGTIAEIVSIMQKEHGCRVVDGSEYEKMKKGGYVKLSKTPAPKKERIYGSKTNPKGTSATGDTAKSIKFSQSTLETIKNKVDEHNQKHPDKKVTLAIAKAVVRRGMGAYSSTHRPTISGGKPNSRVAWGLARLNAFLYKAVKGKSKSGKYSQDNDLLDELGIKHKILEQGGMFEDGGEIKRYVAEADFYVNAKNDEQAKKEANEVVKLIDDKYDNKATVNHLYETQKGIGNNRKVFKDGGEVGFQPPYPINEAGGYDYTTGKAKETAEKVDLLSLPRNVDGTHCGNCFFFQQGICVHKEIMLPVTDRMCCSVWDNSNSDRSYDKNLQKDKGSAPKNVKTYPKNDKGGYTYSGEALKIAKKFDLITLPKDIEGTNCANCSWYTPYKEGGFCFRSNIWLPVTARMSCAYWNNLSVKRDWGLLENGGSINNQNAEQMLTDLIAGSNAKEIIIEDYYGLDIFEKGGEIKPSSWQMPSRKIYDYAEKIRKNYPEVWDMGGNVFGNEAYKNLAKVIKRGYWKPEEEWMYKKWQAFMARHEGDFRIAGVIANLKWLNWVGKGEAYSKSVIEDEIKEQELKKMAHGGSVGEEVSAFEKGLRMLVANKIFNNSEFHRKFKYQGETYRIDFLIQTDNAITESASMLVFKDSDDTLVVDMPFDLQAFDFDYEPFFNYFKGITPRYDKGGNVGSYFGDLTYPNIIIPNSYFIPESVKNQLASKKIPKKKYDFPFNYSLKEAEDLFKKIKGKDDLRPQMDALYLMGDYVAATDAHKLVFVGMNKKQYGSHWFGYPSPDKENNWVTNVDKEYHAFYQIIPLTIKKADYSYQGVVSITKLYQYLTFLLENEFLMNRTTYAMKMKYKNIDGEINFIGVNAKFLKEVCDVYLKFGILDLHFYLSTPSKAIFISHKKLNENELITKQFKNNIFSLLMPIFIDSKYDAQIMEDLATQDYDYGTGCGIYFDLSKNDVFDMLGRPDNLLSGKTILSESEFQLNADSFNKIYNLKKKQYGKTLIEIIYPQFLKDFDEEKGLKDKKYSDMSNKELKLAVALAWSNGFLY